MTADAPHRFDPLATLAALQAAGVASVVIGGLARVARGADEITHGVDICPSLQPPNLGRLGTALAQLDAARIDGPDFVLDPEQFRAVNVVTLSTAFGELKLVAAPAGVPRGYEALKAGASTEHLGGGLRPEIASTGDLIAMAAALRREQDLERIPGAAAHPRARSRPRRDRQTTPGRRRATASRPAARHRAPGRAQPSRPSAAQRPWLRLGRRPLSDAPCCRSGQFPKWHRASSRYLPVVELLARTG